MKLHMMSMCVYIYIYLNNSVNLDCGIPAYDAVYAWRWLLTFRRDVLRFLQTKILTVDSAGVCINKGNYEDVAT